MRAIGSVAERSQSRIASILSRHFSDDYAALLAEPVPSQDGSGIDWFVDTDEDVRPISALPADQAQAVRDRLEEMIANIQAEIDRIESSGTANREALATALRNAITIPGEDYIWAIGSAESGFQPLLVGWGHTSHEASATGPFEITARGQTLRRPRPGPRRRSADAEQPPAPPVAGEVAAAAAARAAPPAAASVAASTVHSVPFVYVRESGGFWRRWLLPILLALAFLLMLMLLVSYLLPACGLRTPFGNIVFGWTGRAACIQTVNTQLEDTTLQTIAIERELGVLRENFERRRLACVPPEPITDPEPVVEPPRDDFEIEQRGEAQVTLQWGNVDDLDLSVVCPNGQVINYRSRQGCGGTLDIDANANNGTLRNPPGENITFENGLQDPGEYRIRVTHFKTRTRRYPVRFRVRIRDGNGEPRFVEGQLDRPQQTVEVGTLQR
ncbi:hypothetical protein D1F64_12245 [Breoghania sp. L-A4]|nr:hypothetical protein D1F64_12245 [Breoghania sp. L-A4]